jgi:hypothetical protein
MHNAAKPLMTFTVALHKSSPRTCIVVSLVSPRFMRSYLPSVWKVASDHQGNLLLPQLFHGNLKRIRHAFHIDQNWCIRAIALSAYVAFSNYYLKQSEPNLQCPRTQNARSLVLGHVGRRGALVIGNLLVLCALHRVLLLRLSCCGRARITSDHNGVFLVLIDRVGIWLGVVIRFLVVALVDIGL